MNFYVIYLRESHPTDGWQVPINERESVLYEQPKTLEERAAVAGACSLHMDLAMPMLLDEMDDGTGAAYAAFPDRLYIVDAQGNVAFRGEPGPMGFDPEPFESAIKGLVADPSQV